MSVEFTLTVKDIILLLIGIGIIVLVFYLIALSKNLLVTIKKTNSILSDANTVSKIASDRAVEVNGAVSEFSQAMGVVAKNFKGNETNFAALSNLVKALVSLIGIFKKKEG